MKAMLCAGSLLAALAVVIGAGRLLAESKEQKPAREAKPQTRIAVLNLTHVIKNYDKYKNFQEEVKETAAPFQKRDQKLRAQLDKLKAQMDQIKKGEGSSIVPAKAEEPDEDSKKAQQERKEQCEEKARKIQRELEDNSVKAKMVLSKKSDEQMKHLFLDVMEAAQRYAAAHDFDLVLHYNDAVTREDLMSVQNIARKLNTGALMPIYTAPGLDISSELTRLLNEAVRNKG